MLHLLLAVIWAYGLRRWRRWSAGAGGARGAGGRGSGGGGGACALYAYWRWWCLVLAGHWYWVLIMQRYVVVDADGYAVNVVLWDETPFDVDGELVLESECKAKPRVTVNHRPGEHPVAKFSRKHIGLREVQA